jgi:hypothetical protein
MMFRWVAAVSTAIAAALMVAAPAHADERSYLDDLRANGVPVGLPGQPPAQLIQAGDLACRLLRTGMSPDEVVAQFGALAFFARQGVDSAQRELCPDTL